MDPLTITTTVIKVSSACLSTAKMLYEVRAKYKDAPMYIVSITSETTVISASLSSVQSLLLREPDLPNLLASRPELIAALDAALTGCMVLFSCLDDEMSHITASSQPGAISWRSKARMVWNRDKLRELLEALRGLQMSMNMLIQLLQVDSLAEIKKIVEEGRPAFADTIQRTQSLRSSYPQIGVPESVYSRDDREGGGEVEEYAASIWSDRQFDFDDLIVNSKAYRRALAAARAGKEPVDGTSGQTNEQAVFGGDLIDFSDAATITQKTVDQSSIHGATRELAGLTLSGELPADLTPQVLIQSINEHTLSTRSSIDPNTETFSPGIRPTPANVGHKSPEASPAATPNIEGDVMGAPHQSRPALGHTTTPRQVKLKHQKSYQKTGTGFDAVLPQQGGQQPSGSKSTIFQKKKQWTGGPRTCDKCTQNLTGQFVRALGGMYHLDCFTCIDCGIIVANKFFPLPIEEGPDQALCETDYFRRLDLLCFTCGGALRGYYVTALGRKYHTEHFTCALCSKDLQDEGGCYYEHDGNLYCHYDYSTRFAQCCSGCQTAILKQFVEIFRNGQNQSWHPECYMIQKHWNARLGTYRPVTKSDYPRGSEVDDVTRDLVRRKLEEAEERVAKIWSVLSGFEEYTTTMISDLLLHVSNGDALLAAPPMARFIDSISGYIECLLAVDIVRTSRGLERLMISREFKLLCKKFVTILQVMTTTSGHKLGVTQELLSLLTGLAHYTKLLIRIGLQGALQSSALDIFLDRVPTKGQRQPFSNAEEIKRLLKLAQNSSDDCDCCGTKVEGACYMVSDLPYHMECISCPQCKKADAYASENDRQEYELGNCKFCGRLRDENITFLGTRRQFIYLLWVAFARFLLVSKIDWTVALKAER
ncbi:uncharacterized protein BDZ99DRAFT_253794 [Mytilinidion resinicola]|uniref:LIM zinc-binding domain-containing protein n=1 Tax=Mytilinidion resinicola TaxID=574789 RepID=A0A6A6YZ90_9PEZI|nr:uncharacterized protein BDZ99DRAFT_253794 [Mytilinidion resinicola]KAF2813324.1 hypothetical protein BDZ99DRAFT_253794 [Mytilinidion resinicola]